MQIEIKIDEKCKEPKIIVMTDKMTDEVNANNVETASKCEMWLEGWQKSCKTANDLFGLDMSVTWRHNPAGGDTDGNAVIDGAV